MNWKTFFLVAVFPAGIALGVGLGPMVGGYRDADMEDQGAQDALQFAVVQHNRRSNSMFLSQVDEVIKVQTQVVAGINYKFTVQMGKTPCRKGGTDTECPIHQDLDKVQPYTCEFVVFNQVWTNTIKLTKQECTPVITTTV